MVGLLVVAATPIFRTPATSTVKGIRTFVLILMVAQLVFEGFRLQILPAYLAALPLLLLGGRLRGRSSTLLAAAGMGLVFSSAALSVIMPVMRFPDLEGAFDVGTETFQLADESRPEVFGRDPNKRRQVVVQVWYPSPKPAVGARARYRAWPETTLRSAQFGLVRTHAYVNAPIATAAAYPVLLFSPSWNGLQNQNTFQVEELASHGFVVVGINHPYGSYATVFRDGSVIRNNRQNWLDFSSEAGFRQSLEWVEQQLRVRAADAVFVLNWLSRLQENRPQGILAGRVDLNRVGIFGCSFGGAVALEACFLDRRFKAALNMDGLLFGESAAHGIEQPSLIMNSDDPPLAPADLTSPHIPTRLWATVFDQDIKSVQRTLRTGGGYDMTIAGASHANYSDTPLYSIWKRFSGAGPIDVRRAMKIIDRYSLAFFDKHLNRSRQPLLDGPSPDYPEVRFKAYPKNGSAQVTAPPISAGAGHPALSASY
jgi:dienelactone hydrolase